MLHEPNNTDFAQSLMNVEPVSPERQERFREELAQIIDPPLPRSHRLYYRMMLAASIFGVLGSACGLVFQAEYRWAQALFLVLWAASAGWVWHILRRGAEPLRVMQGMSKALVGVSVAVAGVLIYHGLQNPSPSPASVLWALAGVLLFLLMSSINLWNRLLTAERAMREQMLRVEYRLADLASRVPPGPKP